MTSFVRFSNKISCYLYSESSEETGLLINGIVFEYQMIDSFEYKRNP
jgi:hypothetical protein